jgi:magnesium transporter
MRILESVDVPEIERLRAANEFFWLDLMDPPAEAIDSLGKLFDLHPVAVEDLQKFGQRPKLDDYPDYLHIVYYGVERTGPVEIHIIVHGQAMVTVRRDQCATLMNIRDRVGEVHHEREEYAVYRVLDALTDSYFPWLEAVDDLISELEEDVLEVASSDLLHRIVQVKRRLGEMRRRVAPQRDMVAAANDLFARLPGFTNDAHDYFRDVYDHLLRIMDSIDSYRDVLTGLLDVYLSAQSNRLNEWVTRLTVVGTVFLPLTFLTGFFGQNFKYLTDRIQSGPEFWGIGVGLEVLSIVGLMAWFRRSGLRQ